MFQLIVLSDMMRMHQCCDVQFTTLAVCRAHRGLPVGFTLLRYSVLFTVESLSLLCLLVISLFIFIFVLRDDALIS